MHFMCQVSSTRTIQFQLHRALHQEKLYHLLSSTILQCYPVYNCEFFRRNQDPLYENIIRLRKVETSVIVGEREGIPISW